MAEVAGKTRKPKAEEAPAVTEAAKPAQEPAKAPVVVNTVPTIKPVRNRKNRQSGTQIHLFKPETPGTTWVTRCVDHGTDVHNLKRKDAKALVYKPVTWCTGCEAKVKQAAEDARQKAEAAKAAAEAAKPQA